MSNLETAIALAMKVHAGQVDKAGEPYILHPLRVMLKFERDNDKIAAVLHDVIEDGNVTTEDLAQLRFSEDVIIAVECLSRRSDESYDAFIERIATNAIATKVKIEDLRDNLDTTRLKQINEHDLDRLQKYHKALNFLISRTTKELSTSS